jgi:hypothetical protein
VKTFHIRWRLPDGREALMEYRAEPGCVDSARWLLIECGRSHGCEPVECPD